MLPTDQTFKTIEIKKNPFTDKKFRMGLKIKCFAINNITDFLFIATKEEVYLYTLNNYK